MYCMRIKDGFHFIFNSWQFSRPPNGLPTISILGIAWFVLFLKVVGCPLICPLSCPQYPYMEVVGSLICIAKFCWAVHWQPTPLPTELPTVSIDWSYGQPNLHGKIFMDSCAAQWIPTFVIFGSSGLPIELPTVSINGRSWQPDLHCKIPMGSQRAARSGQRSGQLPFYPYGIVQNWWSVSATVTPVAWWTIQYSWKWS